MRSLTLTLLIPLLFLSSCTIDWNDEKDTKIAELENQIQDDTFKKKQECAEKSEKYNKLVEEENTWFSNFEYSVVEMFYSKVKNDCLWILKQDFSWNNTMKTMYFLIPSWGIWIEWNIDRCVQFNNFDDHSKDANDCYWFNERVGALKSQ